MITEIANPTYRLQKVYDLREWDEDLGGYIPLDDDHKNTCNRCGRLHVKVYEVIRLQDNQVFEVGSGCCKKTFGWTPEADEVRRLEKQARELAKNKAYQKIVDLVTPYAEGIKNTPIPRIEFIEDKPFGRYTVAVYGMPGTRHHAQCHDGKLTDERRDCIIHSWENEQIRIVIDALFSDASGTNNYKKWYTARDILQSLLHTH